MFEQLFEDVRSGTVVFLGLLCTLTLLLNAGVLIWLGLRKGPSTMARCPECGRNLHCPHCAD